MLIYTFYDGQQRLKLNILYEGLHNLYSSPNMIRMFKSRRMRWARHVARMGRRGMHMGFWWESQKEGEH
jgi:hypothetical protein